MIVSIPAGSGGQRNNSGRKPIDDKKIQCYSFIRSSVIEALGGKQKVQNIMTEAVQKAYQASESSS